MTDTIEDIRLSEQDMFLTPAHQLERYARSTDFVRDFENALAHFDTSQDATDKLNSLMSWAISKRSEPIGVPGEDRVKAFFGTYENFLNDVLTGIDFKSEIKDADKVGDRERAIEAVTDLAVFNQRFAKALLNTTLGDNPDGKRSVQILHSMLVALHKEDINIGTVALDLLDGARAQAGAIHALSNTELQDQITVPFSEDHEEVKRFDVMAGGDFVVVSKDGGTIVVVDTKGRYYEQGAIDIKRNTVTAKEVEPNYRGHHREVTEKFMIRKLNEVQNGTYISPNVKFKYVMVTIPTATDYLTPAGELIHERNKRIITNFFTDIVK